MVPCVSRKSAVTRTTVKLTPWAPVGMAVGAEVVQSNPAMGVTARMGQKCLEVSMAHGRRLVGGMGSGRREGGGVG